MQGTGRSAERARVTWEKELAVQFDRHKRYPADRSNQAAEIVASFDLDRNGHILSSRVTKSSGDAAFDGAALAMVRRSVPAPPPPVADAGLSFAMPIIFRAKRR